MNTLRHRQQWTPVERQLWVALRRGATVDVRAADPDSSHVWGPRRAVRATVLRTLLVAGPPARPGRLAGLRLAGARITGTLDLAHATIDLPCHFLECWFDEPIDLRGARTRAIFLPGCRIPGVHADTLRTDGELYLGDIACPGEIDLTDAHVSGPLVLSGAHLANPGDAALSADGAEFGSDVLCRDGLRVLGELRLPGARITGDLDLSTATIVNPEGDSLQADSVQVSGSILGLRGFQATGRVALNSAEVGRDVDLSAAVLANPDGVVLACDGMRVGGDLSASHSVLVGEFSLLGAQVTGQIGLGGAELSNPGGDAFSGDGLHAGAGMFCRDVLRVTGGFRLPGARIGGPLSFSTAVLSNPGGEALAATRLVVDGNAFFNEGFSATGEICLLVAHIRGQLSFSTATVTNHGAVALLADDITVDASAFFRRYRADGETRLMGARVGGDVDFAGAELVNDGDALAAEDLDVSGSLFCRYGFRGAGRVNLSGARIGHQLSLRGATLHNPERCAFLGNLLAVGHDIFADEDLTVYGTLDLSRGDITGTITLTTGDIDHAGDTAVDLTETHADAVRLTGRPRGRICLADAAVRMVHHYPEDWPATGELELHGLTYTALRPAGLPVGQWLDWLRRGLPDGYRPQPYEQLATTLRNVGGDRDARVVLLAKQRHRLAQLPWWGKPWGWLQDLAVGYGYVPWRSAGWLVALWLFGWAYFRTQHPLPVPRPSGDYQPALYTLDLMLPVLSIGQRGEWHFTGSAQTIAVLITVGSWILGITVLAGLTRALTRTT